MAKDFNNRADYLEYANSAAFDFSGGDVIGISMWYQHHDTDVTDNRADIIMNGNAPSTGQGWAFRLDNNNDTKYWFIYTSAGGVFETWTSTNTFAQGTSWRHLAWSFTYGTPGTASLYVNGSSEAGSWGAGDGINAPETGFNTRFMRIHNAVVANAVDGVLGDVIIYKNPGVNAQFLSQMRYSPFRFLNGTILALRPGMVNDAADPDLSGYGHVASKGGTLAWVPNPPTAPPFGFVQPSPYAVAVAAGVAGPLVNPYTRLQSLVGGGLA